MANLIRSAKSSCDWDDNELMAYNIMFTAIPAHQFFPQETDVPLTLVGLDSGLTKDEVSSYAQVSPATFHLLARLHFAMDPRQAEYEPVIVSLASEVLDRFGFQKRQTCLFREYTIPLLICDDTNQVACISVCLVSDPSNSLLVLLAAKTLMGPSNVEACMVAGAIATYQFNNNRRREMGLHPLDAMTMPCITMVGTRPAFYLVPVTKALSEAVISGQFPSDRTEVLKCEVASDHDGGMEVPEYRRVAFQYFVAFQSLAQSHWEKFLSFDQVLLPPTNYHTD
ncbi:hypothetical protein DEU56DRAFT_972423 [Suillus clintonianus]|uniref:uncharacterized protein n=1 Tax=Suillus clintonianus TaxID=1904413 RepID=UPI001B871DA9|nr:uncharacterized protein DEU56DRAFT_972423 [Suillus clintonianus]KAG2139282.1 hypothetical protein DEU56DRAFT_972423 [Suillus clintonianus]